MGLSDIFSSKPKRRPYRPRKRKDPELIRREKAEKMFWERASDDPDLIPLYIKKYLSVDVPIANPKLQAEHEIIKARTELRKAAVNQLLNRVINDPEMAKQFSDTEMSQIMEIIGVQSYSGEEDGEEA